MLIYGIVFFIMALGAFISKKNIKYLLGIYILFIFFYALRDNIGVDWAGYETYFNNINKPEVTNRYQFEIGYFLLNKVIAFVFDDYRFVVIIVAVFVGIMFFKSAEKYTDELGLFIFLSMFFIFYPTLESIRQSITVILFFYSIQYIDSYVSKYFVLNIAGILFHRTGVFGLVFYFIYRYKVLRYVSIIVLLLYSILEPYIYDIISGFPGFAVKYEWYFHYNASTSFDITLKIVEYSMLLILSYYIDFKERSLNKLIRSTDKDYMMLTQNLLLIGLVLQLTLARFSDITYRFIYYTDVGVVFAYVLFYQRIKDKQTRYLYILLMIGYVLLRFIRIFPFDNPAFIYSI